MVISGSFLYEGSGELEWMFLQDAISFLCFKCFLSSKILLQEALLIYVLYHDFGHISYISHSQFHIFEKNAFDLTEY